MDHGGAVRTRLCVGIILFAACSGAAPPIGTTVSDAGIDAGAADAGVDAGLDAGANASTDSGIDASAPLDASVDAGAGNAPDSGIDGGVDAGAFDAGPDGGLLDAGGPLGPDGGFAGCVWTQAQMISIDGGNPVPPSVAVDPLGNAIAVWQQGPPQAVWMNRYLIAIDRWDDAGVVSGADNVDTTPIVATDDQGNALAIWEDITNSSGKARFFVSSLGAWGSTTPFNKDPSILRPVGVLALRSLSKGDFVALWDEAASGIRSIWANRFRPDAGLWDDAGVISTATGGSADQPLVERHPNGNLIATWVQSNGTTRYDAWFNGYDSDAGRWGDAGRIENDNAGTSDSYEGTASLAIDSLGNAFAVFPLETGTRFDIWANRMNGGTGIWETAAPIENDNTAASLAVGGTSVAADSLGNAIAVWAQKNSTRYSIFTNQYDPGLGRWNDAGLLETDDVNDAVTPRVVTDQAGNAIVMWSQKPSGGARKQIFERRFIRSTGTWTPSTVIDSDAGDSTNIQLARSLSGVVVAVWQQVVTSRNRVFAAVCK